MALLFLFQWFSGTINTTRTVYFEEGSSYVFIPHRKKSIWCVLINVYPIANFKLFITWYSLRIRARIVPPEHSLSEKATLNKALLWMRLKKQGPVIQQNRAECSTMENPLFSKAIIGQQRPRTVGSSVPAMVKATSQ